MEPQKKGEKKTEKERVETEVKKRKLARPPRDRREVTIGPTTGSGPDITVG